MLISLAVSRMKLHRACQSALFMASLLAINIACFWVLTDVFWGWHFYLSDYAVAPTIAKALWLAGPLFAIVVLLPLVWKENDLWRLRALLAFHVPIGAFNMAMIDSLPGSWDPNVRVWGC